MRAATFALLVLASCGGPGAATPGDRCVGARAPATVSERRVLPTGTAGGPNAWFELHVSRVETVLGDNHLFLGGTEIPIVRLNDASERTHVLDATAGQLSPRKERREDPREGHTLGFRIPAGTPAGKHDLVFKTCDVAAEAAVAIEVLESPAPVVSSIRVVRGEVWSTLYIKGAHLASAEEVVLVGSDEAIASITNVTRVDDGELRVPVDKSGTYEVFVRNANGLGGGPPNGVVTVR